MGETFEQRSRKIKEIFCEIMPSIWAARMRYLHSSIEREGKEEMHSFIIQMKKLLKEWEKVHNDDGLELSYIIISFLRSSVITRSYELQVAFFDQLAYAEENPLCFYWTPKFIFEQIEEDMERFREEARKRIIRLREDEVEEIRRRYMVCHERFTYHYLRRIIEQVIDMPEWKSYQDKKVRLLYGTYMEKMSNLC